MDNPSFISDRKNDHISINLTRDVNSSNTTGLEKFRLRHSALPELDFSDVDTSLNIFGKKLAIPLLISSMTGGTKTAEKYNRIFATVAEKHQIAFGVGSQRIHIELPEKIKIDPIRRFAPTALIFSNLGAVQFNYGFTITDCRKAVDAIEANALILHLNPLQEALMEHGNSDFSGLLRKIESVANLLDVPLIVKEVGWGISGEIAHQLYNAGVSAVDIAGSGGTSWSEVEMHRTNNTVLKKVAEKFKGWGIPTADALIDVKKRNPGQLIFASGGLISGIDIVKSLALGADLCGIARPFLKLAEKSSEILDEHITVLKAEIKVAMFAIGAKNVSEINQDLITNQPDKFNDS